MPSRNDKDKVDAALRTNSGHPAIIPWVSSPERLLRATPIGVATTSGVPALYIGQTSASFETVMQGDTSTTQPLDLLEHMEEAFQTATATDTIEVEEGASERENT